MRRRLFRTFNFIALNILFFALYLNFVHRDQNKNFTAGNNNSNSTQGAALIITPPQEIKKVPLNAGVEDSEQLKN
jgi:hypothetical protein